MWKGFGTKVTGAAHIKAGKPCQDAIRVESYPGGYLIASVADGHGSDACPFSGEGAEAAVDSVHEVFSGILSAAGDEVRGVIENTKDIRLPKQICAEWLSRVQRIHSGAERGDFSALPYGTTVLAVVAAPEFVFALQLGDGDILAVEQSQGRWLITPEYLPGNETHSLCMPDCWRHMKTQMLRRGEKRPGLIMLTTDGYANSFVTDDGFMKAGMDILELLNTEGPGYISESLEDWLSRYSSEGSGDDIAMGLVYWAEQDLNNPSNPDI